MRRLILLFFFALLLLLPACQKQGEPLRLNGSTMGTTWSVALPALPAGIDQETLGTQLQEQLDRINGLMSTYDPDSEISRFNNQGGSEWFAISAETAQVVDLSLQVGALTGGAFDISVGPLVELWGFGASARGKQLPSDLQVNEQLAKVGYRQLQLRRDPAALKKAHPQLRIDLSAIAKGYAADRLAELLEEQKVNNYLIEIGGEMRLAGRRGDNTPWRIAIEKPQEGVRDVETVLLLTDTGLATSGNYRNFYIENGRRYSHTIDPLSGRPIRHQLASVTVLDPSCARADALATALMVLGEDKGRILVEKQRIAAYFLIHAGQTTETYISPALQTFLAQVEK